MAAALGACARSASRGSSPVALNNVGNRVLAQAHLAPDQAISAALGDEDQHLGGEPVGLRPLSGLAAQQLAAGLGGGDAGADAFLRQLALELEL